MSQQPHTPGPHNVEQIGRRPIMRAVAATVLSPSGERLADFRHVADANLFAAAPDMLEALKGFQLKEEWIVSGQAGSLTLRIPLAVIQAAGAAVAKAEGQP